MDISGQRFERLVALRPEGRKWLFRCDCGTEKAVSANNVRRGLTKSCGCLGKEMSARRNQVEKRTHGMTKTAEYKCWQSMRQRCLNPNDRDFENYGARGIRICDRWQKFENFFADMGERPPGKSIDRIDVDGNYEPANCRWATITEQNRNKRDNLIPGSLAALIPTGTAEYQRMQKQIRRERCL